MHPVGSYCTDISRCTVTITLNLFQLADYLELDTSNYFLLFSHTVFGLLLA